VRRRAEASDESASLASAPRARQKEARRLDPQPPGRRAALVALTRRRTVRSGDSGAAESGVRAPSLRKVRFPSHGPAPRPRRPGDHHDAPEGLCGSFASLWHPRANWRLPRFAALPPRAPGPGGFSGADASPPAFGGGGGVTALGGSERAAALPPRSAERWEGRRTRDHNSTDAC
jgi:hypothetical protein